LPLIGASARFWDVKSVPVAQHARGFPRLVAGLLVVALAAVVLLWLGFSIDYATTRDIYFTIAIAHVLAEAPFLLRMI
jgi:multidrug resistance efflux pump